MVCFIFHFGTSRHESIYVFSIFFKKKVLLCPLFVRPTVRPPAVRMEKASQRRAKDKPRRVKGEPKTNQDEQKASQRQTKGVGAHSVSIRRAKDKPKACQRQAKGEL